MSLSRAVGAALCFFAGCAVAAPGGLRGNLAVHDPSTIIKCKDRYYVFGTGRGIISRSSADKVLWSTGPRVFSNPPSWTTNAVPAFDGTFWAPDVLYLNGRYCLYYSVSSWGQQVSAIGLVTNPTLDPADPTYQWTDRGMVIQSANGYAYNTIDPCAVRDAEGNAWLCFGSYWNGIYLVQLDPLTGLRISSGSPTYRLAYNSSIEASCIFRHGAYYYLFVNWGSCCSGVNSTYNIRVGRSTAITGPYRDRNGVDLAANGGSVFLQGTGKFTGPGHAGILSENGSEWLSYHYYDAGDWSGGYNAYGAAAFDLVPLSWTEDQWPSFTNDWSAVYHFEADARDENGQYYGRLLNGASITNDAVRGRVLNLNGTNQFVSLPPGVAYARTFTAVVKWNGGDPWQRIFDFGFDTSRYVMLTPASDTRRLRCDIRSGGSTQTIQGATELPVGVWTHVAVTMDGTRGVLYLNGLPVASRNNMTIAPLDVRAQTNHLGHSKFAADRDFNGQISSFRVHGRFLSAEEITAPQPVIAQPADGSAYYPGTTVSFSGTATDFMDVPLGTTNLSWRVEYIEGGTTNVVLGSVGGSNGSFQVSSNSVTGTYRISLTAADAAGRQRTVPVVLTPANGRPAPWTSFYPFSNGAQDASNRYHGTFSGGASVVTDVSRGLVANFSGASQYLYLPAGVGALRTFAAWVRWNGGGGWQRIFDFGQDTERWFMLTPLDGDGKMQCAITSARSSYVRVMQADAPLPINTWNHIAVTLDGRQGVLYLNGQPAAINNSVNLLPEDVASSSCYLARSHYSADPFFNGRLDSVKITSASLALDEILAPTINLLQPAPGTLYAGGDFIPFAASAFDFSDAPLPPSRFTWAAHFHHDGQSETVLGPVTGVTSGTLPVPTTGPFSTNVFYRFNVSVADAAGNSASAAAEVLPRLAPLGLATVPAGLQLTVDDQSVTAPVSLSLVAGQARQLHAPLSQAFAGSNYNFVLWSDGGSPTHEVLLPATGATYTASYVPPTIEVEAAADNLRLSWPQWAAPLGLYQNTNLVLADAWTLVTNPPVPAAGQLVLFLPVSEPQSFFRLAQP